MKTKAVSVVSLLAVAAIATGCGSSGGTSTQTTTQAANQTSQPSTGNGAAANQDKTVTIAGVKAMITMVPWIAAKQGLFKNHGLNATVTTSIPTDSIVPSLVSGRVQAIVGTWSVIPLFLAAHLDFVGIAGMTVGGATDQDGIYVRASSPYHTMADLKGKTIAVQTLNSISELAVLKAAVNAGLAPTDVHIVPIPLPEMPPALQAGRIDAAELYQPFVSLTEHGTPLREIAAEYPSIQKTGTIPVVTLLVTRKFYDQNPDTVKRLQATMAEGVQFASAHPAIVRAELPAFANIPTAIAENPNMRLPTWSSAVNIASVQEVADLLAKYGLSKLENVSNNVKVAGG